jgi:tetratricopeptide (TPR) repeat protein
VKAPKTSQEFFERALTLHRAGRPVDAEPLYRKVISRNAAHDRALFGLSVILFETGRLQEATRYLERAVEARPHPKYLTNLGEAYRRQGKLELARAAFERVLHADPDFVEARQNLAVTLILQGESAAALAHLERVVELRPDHAVAHVSLAWVLSRSNRPAAARAHAERALEIAPDLALSTGQCARGAR